MDAIWTIAVYCDIIRMEQSGNGVRRRVPFEAAVPGTLRLPLLNAYKEQTGSENCQAPGVSQPCGLVLNRSVL